MGKLIPAIVLLLFSLSQTLSSIIDVNGLQQHNFKLGLKPAAAESETIRIVFIFSISFKVLREEMWKWKWSARDSLESALAKLCELPTLYQSMMFFGDELVCVRHNESYSDVWLNESQVRSQCAERFAMHNYWKQDIGADAYESSREFNTKFLKKIEREVKNYSADGPIYLYIITNFAEKALAKYLNTNPFNAYGNIYTQILLRNIQSANYYFYAVNFNEIRNIYIIQKPYYCYYKYATERYCGFYYWIQNEWPQIYMFQFSNNLTFAQRHAILESVRTPLVMHFAKPQSEPIIVLLASYMKNSTYINPSEFYYPAEFIAAEFSVTSSSLLARSNLMNVDLIESETTHTAALWERSLAVFYEHLYGAQLPPEMEADAIKPIMHPKPRVVLITDYVEEQFINGHLPNRSVFEFKVYALNPTVFGAYEGKADLVFQLNPDEPGEIPIGRNDSEPEPIKRAIIEKIVHKYPSLQILVPIVLGSVALFFLIILILFCRVRRLNWLNKLEKFKTEHLFHAYQKSQTAKKIQNKEQWEMRWDQLLLNSEQLGRGVFGAVYKATLTSLPNWMTFPAAGDVNGWHKEFIKSSGIRKGSQVAVKMLRPEQAYEKHRHNFLKEVEIMKMLGTGREQHHCVVRMLGCMSRPEGTLGLVLEYCPGGNLLEYVKQLGANKEVQESKETCARTSRQFARFGWQICDGMLFLGTKDLVHRDLAARNVLLDGELCAKIADFGLCINMNDVKCNPESYNKDDVKANGEDVPITALALDNERLPIRWLAPECLKMRKFSRKSDLWSFGVLLHEMFTFGRNPFDGVEHKDLLEYILRNHQKGYMEKPAFCPDEIYEIMQKCLTLDEERRPNFAQIQKELAVFLEKNSVEYGYLQLN